MLDGREEQTKALSLGAATCHSESLCLFAHASHDEQYKDVQIHVLSFLHLDI